MKYYQRIILMIIIGGLITSSFDPQQLEFWVYGALNGIAMNPLKLKND